MQSNILTLVRINSTRAKRLVATLSVTIVISTSGAAVWAGPRPCGIEVDANRQAAVAAAEAWRNARWGRVGSGWMASYKLKDAPGAPLGIGTFARREALGVPEKRAGPIAGQIAATAMTCTIYELALPAGLMVRFTAMGLKFNENDGGWSSPLASALIHLLEVTPAAAIDAGSKGSAWQVRESAEARTALPPDARLAPPVSNVVPPETILRQR